MLLETQMVPKSWSSSSGFEFEHKGDETDCERDFKGCDILSPE